MKPFRLEAAASYPTVIGCDEVGRGALCGPVVAAAVWFNPAALPGSLLGELDDSKRLTARQRGRVDHWIRAHGRVVIVAGSARHIDRFGIRTVTLNTMRIAVQRLAVTAKVCVDGVDIPPGLNLEAEAIVRGESVVPQIAAASVCAKVFRDGLMAGLAARYPAYGWDRNAGYGTAQHLAALRQLGATPHHRRSFSPVAQVGLPFDEA